jgi:CO/xanthine dehydrogenase Mo-binding subunit
MALMAAETLGIDYHQIRSIVADISSVGYTHVTGGSRVTFATGMAVVETSKKIVDELRARAAMIWDVDVEGSSGRTARPSPQAAMSAISRRCRSRNWRPRRP